MNNRISGIHRRIELGPDFDPTAHPKPASLWADSRQPRIIIIGHKNPDTDSIAAAAAYAELKCMMGIPNVTAACAGLPSARTEFLFKKFNVPLPPVLSDVYPRVRDVADDQVPTISAGHTLLEAMELLQKTRCHRVPVVDATGYYLGMVSLFDLADKLVLMVVNWVGDC